MMNNKKDLPAFEEITSVAPSKVLFMGLPVSTHEWKSPSFLLHMACLMSQVVSAAIRAKQNELYDFWPPSMGILQK